MTGEIAKRLGLTIRAVQKRRLKDKDIAQAIEVEESIAIGYAESVLIEAIRSKKNIKAAMWYLERKGKELGYGKSVKVDGNVNPVGTVHLYLPDNGRDPPPPTLGKSNGSDGTSDN
jgi:hypothetical protein